MPLHFHLPIKGFSLPPYQFRLNNRVFTSECIAKENYNSARSKGLFRHTPVIKIKHDGVFYHLKLECFQPSGSFKDRGIGFMIHKLLSENPISRVICSSGGNAGLAAALACQNLNIPIDIFCPKTTLSVTINKMKNYGANVNVIGENWNEADCAARTALSNIHTAVYIPPFDHPLIFYGNSSLIEEVRSDVDGKIDAIVVTCGGGGLLAGILNGCKRFGMYDTDILVLETEGAASFAVAKKHNQVKSIIKISTIATTLGALCVTEEVLKYNEINTISVVVTDRQAVNGCLEFANNHRILVEPAAGAGLSILYDRNINHTYIKAKPYTNVVIVVCGGSGVDINLLNQWKDSFGL